MKEQQVNAWARFRKRCPTCGQSCWAQGEVDTWAHATVRAALDDARQRSGRPEAPRLDWRDVPTDAVGRPGRLIAAWMEAALDAAWQESGLPAQRQWDADEQARHDELALSLYFRREEEEEK